MPRRKDFFKHDAGCLFVQVFFLVVSLFFVAKGEFSGELLVDAWFYLYAMISWFSFSLLTFGILRGRARHFATIINMMVNSYLVPISVYSCGASVPLAVVIGAIYIIAVVVVATNDIAFSALMASLLTAFFFHNHVSPMETEHASTEYFYIFLSYVGLVVVALGWRTVLTRIYCLIRGLPMPGQVSEDDFEAVERENQLMRKKIAQFIVNIQKVTRQEKLGKES